MSHPDARLTQQARPGLVREAGAGFLGRAIARFAGLGVKTERVLTDNSGNYQRGLPGGRG